MEITTGEYARKMDFVLRTFAKQTDDQYQPGTDAALEHFIRTVVEHAAEITTLPLPQREHLILTPHTQAGWVARETDRRLRAKGLPPILHREIAGDREKATAIAQAVTQVPPTLQQEFGEEVLQSAKQTFIQPGRDHQFHFIGVNLVTEASRRHPGSAADSSGFIARVAARTILAAHYNRPANHWQATIEAERAQRDRLADNVHNYDHAGPHRKLVVVADVDDDAVDHLVEGHHQARESEGRYAYGALIRAALVEHAAYQTAARFTDRKNLEPPHIEQIPAWAQPEQTPLAEGFAAELVNAVGLPKALAIMDKPRVGPAFGATFAEWSAGRGNEVFRPS